MPIDINAEYFQTGLTWTDYMTKTVKRNKEALQTAYDRDHPVAEAAKIAKQLKAIAPY